jgi:glycoside/pentoside/hexuronide:cation symporter, GPH family
MKTLSYPALFSYGLFGLPLALVALPIYVYVPQFYAARFGLSLTLIGTALLVARILDAFIDPAIGLWIDRQRSHTGYQRVILISLPLLAIGFIALFHPPQVVGTHPFLWFLCSLMVVYLGFSLATIAYQSWGASLTQARAQRSRVTAIREACGLVGVVIAAALPGFADIGWLSLVFIVSLLTAAIVLLLHAPRPALAQAGHPVTGGLLQPLRNARFRWLFAVFMLNGIAAAIPATLFLFFANDRLGLPQYAGLFLVLYFIAAALSMPLWVALAKRHGEQHAWLISMLLSIAVFVWAYFLSSGAITGFALICIFSGFSLGADLALPPALLAAVIGEAGDMGTREGAYFGIWSWATKMNLALAAGISLPLLELLGYLPGITEVHGLHALAVGYALLPCLLKLVAALLLWRAPLNAL